MWARLTSIKKNVVDHSTTLCYVVSDRRKVIFKLVCSLNISKTVICSTEMRAYIEVYVGRLDVFGATSL